MARGGWPKGFALALCSARFALGNCLLLGIARASCTQALRRAAYGEWRDGVQRRVRELYEAGLVGQGD